MGRSGLLISGSVLSVTAACVTVLLYLKRRRRRTCLRDAVETDEDGNRASVRLTEAPDQTFTMSPEKSGMKNNHSDQNLDSWDRWHYLQEEKEELKATACESMQAPRPDQVPSPRSHVFAPEQKDKKLCSQTEERRQKLTACALAVHEKNNRGLFTSDGTEVRDLPRYLATMQATGGYQGGLFDSEGKEVRNPLAYISEGGADKQHSLDGVAFYTADGKRISHPARYVRVMQKDSYEDLYTADGEIIRNAERYVRQMRKPGSCKGGLYNSKGEQVVYVVRTEDSIQMDASSRVTSLAGTSKAGTSVRQAVKCVASPQQRSCVARYIPEAERSDGYKGGLFDARGREIEDPYAYLQLQGVSGSVDAYSETSATRARATASHTKGSTFAAYPTGSTRGYADSLRGHDALYKADGSEVRDPVKYVAAMQRKMQRRSGYEGGLYNARGEEIWDPVAYVDGIKGRGRGRQNAANGRSFSHWNY